jgi:hypothetical protein
MLILLTLAKRGQEGWGGQMNDERRRQQTPSGKKTPSAGANELIAGDTTDTGAQGGKRDSFPVKWSKLIVSIAAAIVAIGGALAIISQFTHWLTSSPPQISQVEKSPILGVSFYQNGQLDPMSLSGSDQNQVVNVSMTAGQPFELWFPALQNAESAIEVCTAYSSAIDNNIPQTGQNGVFTCLTPGTGAADYPYASGGLPISTPPDQLGHAQITGTRAEDASGGDQKYYVSNLTSYHGKVYLVIYMNDNNDKSFEPNNVEYFTLNLG